MRKSATFMALSIPILVVVLMLAGCAKAEQSAAPAAAEPTASSLGILEAGKLIVGTSADYPPYEFRLQKDNSSEIVGIDIAIAEAIATELNLKLEVRDFYFSKLFPALDNGEVDMLIAGLSPTEDRKQKMDFSEVYYTALQNMVVRKADHTLFSDLDNLRDKRIGTQQSSIQAEMVKKVVRGAQFLEKQTVHELIDALKANELDAVMIEAPVAEALAYKDSDLAVIEIAKGEATPGLEMLVSAIAVKKGNQALLDQINVVLRKLISENRIDSYAADAKTLMDLP
jgi:polar amino acid transport system substrate-binding protein